MGSFRFVFREIATATPLTAFPILSASSEPGGLEEAVASSAIGPRLQGVLRPLPLFETGNEDLGTEAEDAAGVVKGDADGLVRIPVATRLAPRPDRTWTGGLYWEPCVVAWSMGTVLW